VTSTADDTRRRNERALRGYFGGISVADVDLALSFWQPDGRLELPFSDVIRPPELTDFNPNIDGTEMLGSSLRDAFEVMRFALEITAVHDLVDPEVLVAEYVSSGRILTTGKPYANRYICVTWFRDGLISLHREYLNPIHVVNGFIPD
jgi:ketosteroid isomerase-like protein